MPYRRFIYYNRDCNLLDFAGFTREKPFKMLSNTIYRSKSVAYIGFRFVRIQVNVHDKDGGEKK